MAVLFYKSQSNDQRLFNGTAGKFSFDKRLQSRVVYSNRIQFLPQPRMCRWANPFSFPHRLINKWSHPWPVLDWAYTSTYFFQVYKILSLLQEGSSIFTTPTVWENIFQPPKLQHWHTKKLNFEHLQENRGLNYIFFCPLTLQSMLADTYKCTFVNISKAVDEHICTDTLCWWSAKSGPDFHLKFMSWEDCHYCLWPATTPSSANQSNCGPWEKTGETWELTLKIKTPHNSQAL